MKIIKSDHLFIALTYFILRKIAGIFIRILWIKSVNGLENIPLDKSAILAFNHQSFLDFMAFAAVAPKNVHFLAAEKFFSHPILRSAMFFTGQIKVDRYGENKYETYVAVERHVQKNMLIGIFPEGTRSPHKSEMLKAFTGVAQFSLKHNIPIIPVGIVGTFEVWPKHQKFPKFSGDVEIKIGEPLYFDQYKGMHDDKNTCVNVTEKVMKEIERLSERSYPHYTVL
jgi:1-acyl-sn-glycerol-3-phosphate acyltransferase